MRTRRHAKGRNAVRRRRVVLAGTATGAAIASEIERELKEGLCAILPVKAAWLRLNYGFILKGGRAPSPATKAFMDIVREIEPACRNSPTPTSALPRFAVGRRQS
jgi:hypothetical protein